MEKPLAAVCLGCCATMLLYGYVCEILSLDTRGGDQHVLGSKACGTRAQHP